MNDTLGSARFVGSAVGVVHDGPQVVEWLGEAGLYVLDPPLRGYRTIVASTLARAPRIAAAGGVEYGVETFLWGVTGEDLQRGSDADELPGSGWGNTLADALAEAGYALA
jgi:hypothetical protein